MAATIRRIGWSHLSRLTGAVRDAKLEDHASKDSDVLVVVFSYLHKDGFVCLVMLTQNTHTHTHTHYVQNSYAYMHHICVFVLN